MATITYVKALQEAFKEEMERDSRVIVFGEDVELGYVFQATAGLVEIFGRERVFDTPMSEAAIAGLAVGAAMVGMRPVAEIMYMDWVTLAMDQIVNQAAKARFMTGGQAKISAVFRMPMGLLSGFAAQHCQCLHDWFAHIPGLIVVTPATPADAKGLLKSSIRSDDPVVFIEHKMLYKTKGEVPDDKDFTIPFGKAAIHRKGKDVTIVAFSWMVEKATEAADKLKEAGISATVVDPRTLRPLDTETILQEVANTGRLVIVDEGNKSYGVAAEIAALAAEQVFDSLNAPIKRICLNDTMIPFSKPLEDYVVVKVDDIVKAVNEVMEYN